MLSGKPAPQEPLPGSMCLWVGEGSSLLLVTHKSLKLADKSPLGSSLEPQGLVM